MNEENYTSLELSKKLHEAGCELDSKYAYYIRNGHPRKTRSFLICNDDKINNPNAPLDFIAYSYDILNDICVKYAKEFFGEAMCKTCGGYGLMAMNNSCEECIGSGDTTVGILSLIQEGNKKAVEDYIWLNCKFNPKNQ